SGPLKLCPHCAQRRATRSTYRTWGLAAATLALIPLAAWVGLLPQILWMPMLWAAVVISIYLSVLPHELGHALVARAVGYRPLAIIWGGFPSVYDGHVFGVRTLIGLAPASGLAFYEPADDRWPRLKAWVITAAGPLVNVLLAAAAFAAASALGEPFRHSSAVFVLLAFAIGNAVLAAVNLWPHEVVTVAGKSPSDGARLLRGAFGRENDLSRVRVGACQVRMFFAFRDREYEAVLAEAAKAEGFNGPAPWIELARSAALCSLDRPAQAREVLVKALGMAQADADPGTRALIDNNLAWANFMIDDPADDTDSLERSARAFAALPWMAEVVNTRACVLASRAKPGSERLAEARALLAHVGELHQTSVTRRASVLAAGLIAAAEGDLDAARRERDALRAQGHTGMVERLLESRIGSG
ncbi:MAG TPA: site-2 protease family protein, partial [Steroidobacteraceae bacterium]